MDKTPPDTPATSSEPKLLDQVRNRIRVEHYSIRTESQYVHWIKRFILFHGKRHPRDMGWSGASTDSVRNKMGKAWPSHLSIVHQRVPQDPQP